MTSYNIYQFGRRVSKRKPFKTSTKKNEWDKSAGRSEGDFKTTSYCRKCGIKLIWKGGGYDFDHKDNNPANNSQRNCYLVCKTCHGKHTKVGKRKVKNIMGVTVSYQTIKKKVGYKKQTRQKHKPTKKKRQPRGLDFGIRLPKW